MGHIYTTTEGMVRVVLEKERPRWNCLANDSIIVANADGAITRMEIRRTIDDLAEQGQLVQNPKVTAALDAAKLNHSDYDFNFLAIETLVLDAAEELGLNIASVTGLTRIMSQFIEQNKVQLSAQARERQREREQAKQAAEARLRLLTSILQGRKDTYPEWSSKHGKVIYIDVMTLEKKTTEELAQIEREVADLRRRMGMSREQQKETLHDFANQNRVGYDPDGNKIVGFENRPKTDSLDKPANRPYSEDSTKSAISVRTEARHGETDRAVSQVNGAATPSGPFISPATGREYTKKEIYSLAKNDLKTFRALMKKDQNRLNRLIN